MSRPSSNTDAKLLKAGRDLLPETGVSGMNIRQVAKKARVNVGMFHYHFKTKDAFARRVLQEYYEELFSALESGASRSGSPLERLRAVILAFGRFARDNRRLILALLRDVALGEQATVDFVRANLHRHVELILRLTAEAQAARQIGPMDPINAFVMLITAANLPSIMAEVVHRYGALERVASIAARIEQQVLRDEAIAERVDAMLIGLVVQREDLPPEEASVPSGALSQAVPEARGADTAVSNAD
jgi:AcrR family transcriptional regulator